MFRRRNRPVGAQVRDPSPYELPAVPAGDGAKQIQFWKNVPEAKRITLPADALAISSRLGEQWLYIRCSGQDDTEVIYYAEWDSTVQVSHPSVLDWLEKWRAEAEEAIASGYYKLGMRN